MNVRKLSYDLQEGKKIVGGDPFLNDYNFTKSQKEMNQMCNTTSQLFNSQNV